MAAVDVDPVRGGLEAFGRELDFVNTTDLGAADEAGAFEDAQVARDGGGGDGERLGQPRNGGTSVAQALDDPSANGIGERGEDGIERGIVNHLVNNSTPLFELQLFSSNGQTNVGKRMRREDAAGARLGFAVEAALSELQARTVPPWWVGFT
jgi:hypothetical protein